MRKPHGKENGTVYTIHRPATVRDMRLWVHRLAGIELIEDEPGSNPFDSMPTPGANWPTMPRPSSVTNVRAPESAARGAFGRGVHGGGLPTQREGATGLGATATPSQQTPAGTPPWQARNYGVAGGAAAPSSNPRTQPVRKRSAAELLQSKFSSSDTAAHATPPQRLPQQPAGFPPPRPIPGSPQQTAHHASPIPVEDPWHVPEGQPNPFAVKATGHEGEGVDPQSLLPVRPLLQRGATVRRFTPADPFDPGIYHRRINRSPASQPPSNPALTIRAEAR